MLGWLKRGARTPSADDVVVSQPPGEIFPWPKGVVLTAVDEVVLAVPTGLFDKDRPMGEFLFSPDDMQMEIPPTGDTFFIRLTPGMSVGLAKSVQSCVMAEDGTPRRLKVTRPRGQWSATDG